MSISDEIRVEPDAKKMRGLIADAAAESKSIADSANSTSQEAKGTANAAKTQVDENKNQIANIVANGSSGSLQEIVDVRTGADGTVHASAGEHVRAIDSFLADITNEMEVT
ncbi:MAG: hypothetical protein K0S61_2251 [Anaerocolumna sp.]|jgi:hypothetical protein|nr:hypothetical protein [Anaerocolumna sp.]